MNAVTSLFRLTITILALVQQPGRVLCGMEPVTEFVFLAQTVPHPRLKMPCNYMSFLFY